MGTPLRRTITCLTAVCAAVWFAPTASAATPHLGIDYDLDGSPTPTPASLGQLDLYVPDGATADDDLPVVVYVHGGAWRQGDKSNQVAAKVPLFTEAGYVFASVNYRLSPNPVDASYPANRIRFPDHPGDVGEALAWIDRNVSAYGGDPSRVLLIGHSAGAHLVSLVSTDPSYVEAYGMKARHLIGTASLDTDAYDVVAKATTGTPRSRPLFYNAFATPAENEVDDAWSRASPIRFADPADPRFLLVTQAAAPGRVQGSREMADALGQDPDPSVFLAPYDHAGINAAVGSTADPAGETGAIMDFFDRMVEATATTSVRIDRAPKGKVRLARGKRARVRFRFHAAKAAARFECRLDGRTFRGCESPVSYEVGKGRHRFRVRAIASNGDRGPTETVRFRVLKKRPGAGPAR